MTTITSEERAVAPIHWSIERDETVVEFTAKTFWGLMTVHACFDRFDGSYELGASGTTIELTIDADSLDTGNPTRDKHLRSTDFFDVVEHPQVRFTSIRVHHVTSEILHVVGNLEVAGIAEPLEFAVTVRPAGDGLAVEVTTVDQRRFGMSSGLLGMIRRPATVHVEALLKRDADGLNHD
jgi:polyisoprenoid-binding protein YceI